MNNKDVKKSLFLTTTSMIVVIVVLLAATYAWFTSNSAVDTNTVSGKSGTASLTLLIGPSEGEMVDSSAEEVTIKHENENQEELLPVSTEKLDVFWACKLTEDGIASESSFYKDTEAKNYYHGKLFMELRGDNIGEETKYNLYFDINDEYGGVIGKNAEGTLLNSGRLGLTFNKENPRIFRFAEETQSESMNNTKIGGVLLDDGYVLDSDMKAVTDPAVLFDNYVLNSSDSSMEVPEESIATLDLNTVYEVDVYFYLEGCDKDCIEVISGNDANLHLAFYAVAE